MEIKSVKSYRLVKSEDLNHHGTLFAGRTSEWFVESGFIAASLLINPRHLICVNIHGMHFIKPVKLGQTVCFESKVIHTGNSSIITYTKVSVLDEAEHTEKVVVDGFITYLYVDENTRPKNHNIVLEFKHPKDIKLNEIAKNLKDSIWTI